MTGPWNDAQREFMKNLEAVGATKAEHAVPIDRTMGLPARDLQALIDAGVVREAAANGYYVYPRQIAPAQTGAGSRVDSPIDSPVIGRRIEQTRGKRILRTIVFWLIVILLPIILLQMMSPRR